MKGSSLLLSKKTGNGLQIINMEDNDFQCSLDIVICVLKEKDIPALNKVKDFLYALPSRKQTEQVLALATLHFAQYDKSVFDWIIAHQASLSPELDLFTFVRTLVRARLCEKGWVQGRDFWFDLQSILRMSQSLRIHFFDYFNRGELALVRTILVIDS